jgi:NAD(P)-dependent dehydrogenase (short-subunit alcohol dehydrogenase family)
MSRLGYKVAIVTGGAQGFGASAAEALAADGATVLLTGTQDEEGGAFAAALRARSLRAEYHHLDTSDAMGWAVLADKIMRTHGHLDVLVNHAGGNISTTVENATAAQLREILDENLLGPFLGSKAVIAAMRQSGGGSIINIAANAIVEILPLYALYGAAKAALVNLTKTTAVHCFQRSYDIRVNAVHPGTHETPLLTDNALRSTEAPNLTELLATLPARGPGPLYEFGAAITYLAADESAHITGTELYCDGALTAQNFASTAS